MKKIIILEQEFEYKVYADVNEHDGIYCWTEFYQGLELKKHKKYFFFGEIITKTIPKEIFRVWYDIENPHITKVEIKNKLERCVILLSRHEEIKRGEIV